MVSASRCLLICTLMTSGVALAAASAAVAPVMKDDGKFFSEEAIAKANRKIKQIAQDYKKDLLIETFADIPAERKKDYKAENKREFFAKWAKEQAHDKAVNGVYILICKSPSRLEIEVGNETQKKAFTLRDRNEMGKMLLAKFKDKKYDEGLQEAVDFYAETLKRNLGKATSGRAVVPPSKGAPRGGNNIMGWLCIGAVVLLGVWLLFGLIRAVTGGGHGGQGAYGGGGYGGGGYGGGGFLTSLMGGMLGGAAGSWMYNHFLGGGSSGGGNAAQAGAPPSGFDSGAAEDTDYSGSGGDFGGDDGGGGDFDGGGDFGGGDFDGGGDF